LPTVARSAKVGRCLPGSELRSASHFSSLRSSNCRRRVYTLAGLVSAAAARNYSRTVLLFAVCMGVALGVNSTLIGVIGPIIERWADRLPDRRLGVFGTFLILCGFLLESVEHWLVLFGVPIR
jgi:hypothetical protein